MKYFLSLNKQYNTYRKSIMLLHEIWWPFSLMNLAICQKIVKLKYTCPILSVTKFNCPENEHSKCTLYNNIEIPPSGHFMQSFCSMAKTYTSDMNKPCVILVGMHS